MGYEAGYVGKSVIVQAQDCLFCGEVIKADRRRLVLVTGGSQMENSLTWSNNTFLPGQKYMHVDAGQILDLPMNECIILSEEFPSKDDEPEQEPVIELGEPIQKYRSGGSASKPTQPLVGSVYKIKSSSLDVVGKVFAVSQTEDDKRGLYANVETVGEGRRLDSRTGTWVDVPEGYVLSTWPSECEFTPVDEHNQPIIDLDILYSAEAPGTDTDEYSMVNKRFRFYNKELFDIDGWLLELVEMPGGRLYYRVSIDKNVKNTLIDEDGGAVEIPGSYGDVTLIPVESVDLFMSVDREYDDDDDDDREEDE